MKVWLDAPILAAAFTTRGLCADVLRAVLAHHELLTTPSVLRELRALLIETLGVPPAAADQIVPFIRGQASLLEPARIGADVRVSTVARTHETPGPPPITDPRGFWRMLVAVR